MRKIVDGIEIEMTQAEIDAKLAQDAIGLAKIQARENDYRLNREKLFPSYGDQLDMQYWDHVNGTTKWFDLIASIKAKYPKPV